MTVSFQQAIPKSNDICSICREAPEESSSQKWVGHLVTLDTGKEPGHFCHESCILPWLEQKANCPTCNAEVKLPFFEYLKRRAPSLIAGFSGTIAAIPAMLITTGVREIAARLGIAAPAQNAMAAVGLGTTAIAATFAASLLNNTHIRAWADGLGLAALTSAITTLIAPNTEIIHAVAAPFAHVIIQALKRSPPLNPVLVGAASGASHVNYFITHVRGGRPAGILERVFASSLFQFLYAAKTHAGIQENI